MLLWYHTFFLCDDSPRLSSLSRSFSWEVNKLNQIWFIMSNYELKSKLYMLSWCSVCLFRLCECCLFKRRGIESLLTHIGTADWQQVLLCAWTEGGSIIPKKNRFVRHCFIFLSLILPSPSVLSWYHFFLHIQLQLYRFVFLSFPDSVCLHTHTYSTIMHIHTQRESHTCTSVK